ncbi:MAG: PEP-CTERM sorting domain-containing protein [Planctomycetales bacterium]|nr:PEP-CTERM sorting domain-containing protein [Planctomycetales bacterium]
MTTNLRKTLVAFAAFAALAACVGQAGAQTTVTVNPGAAWIGYMNVSNLPAPDGDGAFQFGSGWGTADLTATFAGSVLTLGPNTIGDPDPYWYIGGGGPGAAGNKIMEANMYVEETGTLNGQNVTFTGNVLSNTFTQAHTAEAFIRDFAPDYSSFDETVIPLTPGVFSISLATNPDAGRHVQYGFTTTGVNVWATDVGPYGSVQVTGVPEPATIALAGLALLGVARLRRR